MFFIDKRLSSMANTSYSLIIRTLNGGGKYDLLLKSIDKQTVKPDHVYIIQPHGYEPPKEQLGYEEYIHTNKGMWEQRIFGMEYCFNQPNHSKYLLVCDDDVAFEPDFAERLMQISEEYNADCLVPIQDYRAGRKNQILGLLTGQRTENKTSKYKITIKRNGSFSVNNDLPDNVNPTQSGPFQCFMMRTDITPELRLRDEMWLDETRYAWPDDQVFFYKAHTLGFNVMSCKEPKFEHLDARSGVSTQERKADMNFSQGRNAYIFWEKFLYAPEKNPFARTAKLLAVLHQRFSRRTMMIFSGLKHRNFSSLRSYNTGVEAGKQYFK